MLRFAHSEYLYALYLIPILLIVYWITQKRQNLLLNLFANNKLHKLLFPLRSQLKSLLKFGITIIGLVLIIVALANPQIGSKIEEVKQVGIDVFILLDVSLSMTAEDIKPSRLDKAKHQISRLIRKLRGDRIGLIVFSGEAYVQIPLTTDYSAANLFLNAVDITSVPQPGTAIGSAISLAINSFKEDSETKKAIIIITDGEDHEGDLSSIIDDANSKTIQIYTIGLGSPTGVPIPIYNTSGAQVGYKKDRRGNVVLTKLDETTLQEISDKGNGRYYRGSNTENELDLIYSDLAKLEQTEFGAKRITEYEDKFFYFLAPAILLLLIEFFITNNKSKLFMKFEE
ncbi:VWA domain-containing protein [Bacteroidota bacterium]